MPDEHELLRLTATIVSAHLRHNAVPADSLTELIRSVHTALRSAGRPEEAGDFPRQPAVPIRKSVFPDYIICLEDGKKLKMLKRHLRAAFGMTPDEYRVRWGLPSSYPMIAPSYAARRSNIARQIGLGQKNAAGAPPDVPVQRILERRSGLQPKAHRRRA